MERRWVLSLQNKELFPVVTIIIMEAFINKMRRLKGVRKQLIVEEAWKALSTANMAEYLRYMYKTVRKYYGEAIVVTQEVEDIISSPVVKEAIINNSDCKIPARPAQVHEPFRRNSVLVGADRQGEGADSLDQPVQRPFPYIQGGLDRSGRRSVGGLCHGGQRPGVPGLHDRGNGESGGTAACRGAGR